VRQGEVAVVVEGEAYTKVVSNSDRYVVKGIRKAHSRGQAVEVEVERLDDGQVLRLSPAQVSRTFHLGCCPTMDKIQGKTLEEPYCVLEWGRLDRGGRY
jgi:hypothetical protein